MTTPIFYHIALAGHIIGLTMMAGTTLTDYVVFKQFQKQYAIDKAKAITMREAASKFPLLFGIGFIVLIISGVAMMAMTNGVFGEQIWFRIKFGLILVILLNGLAFGRRQNVKLKKLLSDEASGKIVEASISNIKNNLSLFYIFQLLLFTTIFVLSIFKFN